MEISSLNTWQLSFIFSTRRTSSCLSGKREHIAGKFTDTLAYTLARFMKYVNQMWSRFMWNSPELNTAHGLFSLEQHSFSIFDFNPRLPGLLPFFCHVICYLVKQSLHLQHILCQWAFYSPTEFAWVRLERFYASLDRLLMNRDSPPTFFPEWWSC